MTSPQMVRNGRKRANSADEAVNAKRVKADQSIVEYGRGSDASRTDHNEANGYTNGGSPASRRKPRVVGNDGNTTSTLDFLGKVSKRESSAAPSLPGTGEARPDLGDKTILQAVPASTDSTDNVRKSVPKKVGSWQAFKKAALKLKEAGHKSAKIEIDPRTSLTKFFPLVSPEIFEEIPFKNCALEYRFETEGDKPAGASLTAELELKGPLKRLRQIFSTVLGQQEPNLRVTAFLGLNLAEEEDVLIDSLTMVGCFIGCNIAYPTDSKLIRITSLGAAISISKKGDAILLDAAKAAVLPSVVAEEVTTSLELHNDLVGGTSMALSTQLENERLSSDESEEFEEEEDEMSQGQADDEEGTEEQPSSHINYSVFGAVELPVPGQPLALTLDLDLSVIKGMLLFTMCPKGSKKAWDNVFGFDNIDLEDVVFKVGYPLTAKEDEGTEEAEDDDKTAGEEIQETGRKQVMSRQKQKDAEDEDAEAKTEKEFSHLTGRFDMENEEKKDIQPFIALQASWESSIGKVTILGKITEDFVSSTLKGTLEDVTFAKVKQLFERTHNVSLGDTDIDIQAKTLTVELSKEGLRLEGALTIYGKEVTAKLLLSTEGVSLSAATPKWEVDDEGTLTIEDAQVSFFVGCAGKNAGDDNTAAKAIKKSVGWYGGFMVKGTFTFQKDLKITVSLQIVRKAGGGWGYIVTGQLESDLSLADLVDYCPKNGDLDFSLKKIWLIASNIDVDPTILPPDAQKFPVKKGIFLCAYLDTVPLIDGESNLVKKDDPKDLAYLYLGLQSGGLPSVAIYLPKTMSVDLGPRMKVGDFCCRLSLGTSGPKIQFFGHVVVTLEEKRKLDFELMVEGDAVGGDLSIVMDGIIKNPFGLSERISLGATGDGQKLGVQVGVIWAQLAATGLPSGLGLSGTLSLDRDTSKEKTYGMTVNLSENPMDFIIIINATSLSYPDLVNIASALTSTEIPAGDVSGASFRNLEVYASLGGSFGSQSYPPGLRMRGVMSMSGKEAFFNCDISMSGLKLMACVPSFEVGCLKLTGEKDLPDLADWPVAMQQLSAEKLSKGDADAAALVASQHYQGKYALLNLQVTLAKQYFMLNGKIEIFGLVTYADIDCQYKPTPKFSFDFKLQWNDLIKLEFHAKMLNNKYLDRPCDADFEVSAVFEQTIIRQIIETLTSVLKTTSKSLTEGVGAVKAEVEALEKKKRELFEKAIRKLEEAEKDLASEKQGIEQRMNDNKQRTLDQSRKLEEEKAKIEAKKQERQREANEKREKEKREARDRKNQREAAENDIVAQLARRRYEKEAQKAQQERNMRSEFGGVNIDDILRDARQALDSARSIERYWDKRVDDIDGFWHPLDETEARANLTAVIVIRISSETALDLLERLIRSDSFRNATNLLNELGDGLNDLTEQVQTGLRQAQNFAKDLGDQLEGTMKDIDHACNTMINEAQAALEQKSAEITNFVAQQQAALNQLNLDLQKVINGATADLVRIAKEECEKCKNDDTLLVAARQSLDSFDQLQRGAFDTLKGMIKNVVGDLVDVEHVSLYGKITADARQQQPFVITIKGQFAGSKAFMFQLEWMPWRPGADDMALFKKLTDMVMAFLKGDAVGLKKLAEA